MAERRHVAALLQLEAHLVDAARRVDREHQLQVDLRLRRRRRPHDGGEHQHPTDDARRGDQAIPQSSHAIVSHRVAMRI